LNPQFEQKYEPQNLQISRTPFSSVTPHLEQIFSCSLIVVRGAD
jgi:hypothetical protein